MTLSEIEARGLTEELSKPKPPKKKAGRPRKLLDTRKQFSLSYWYSLIMKDFDKLRPAQRTRLGMEFWKTLVSKAQTLPADPEQSTLNASDALQMLKDLESNPSLQPLIAKETKDIASASNCINNIDKVDDFEVVVDVKKVLK